MSERQLLREQFNPNAILALSSILRYPQYKPDDIQALYNKDLAQPNQIHSEAQLRDVLTVQTTMLWFEYGGKVEGTPAKNLWQTIEYFCQYQQWENTANPDITTFSHYISARLGVKTDIEPIVTLSREYSFEELSQLTNEEMAAVYAAINDPKSKRRYAALRQKELDLSSITAIEQDGDILLINDTLVNLPNQCETVESGMEKIINALNSPDRDKYIESYTGQAAQELIRLFQNDRDGIMYAVNVEIDEHQHIDSTGVIHRIGVKLVPEFDEFNEEVLPHVHATSIPSDPHRAKNARPPQSPDHQKRLKSPQLLQSDEGETVIKQVVAMVRQAFPQRCELTSHMIVNAKEKLGMEAIKRTDVDTLIQLGLLKPSVKGKAPELSRAQVALIWVMKRYPGLKIRDCRTLLKLFDEQFQS